MALAITIGSRIWKSHDADLMWRVGKTKAGRTVSIAIKCKDWGDAAFRKIIASLKLCPRIHHWKAYTAQHELALQNDAGYSVPKECDGERPTCLFDTLKQIALKGSQGNKGMYMTNGLSHWMSLRKRSGVPEGFPRNGLYYVLMYSQLGDATASPESVASSLAYHIFSFVDLHAHSIKNLPRLLPEDAKIPKLKQVGKECGVPRSLYSRLVTPINDCLDLLQVWSSAFIYWFTSYIAVVHIYIFLTFKPDLYEVESGATLSVIRSRPTLPPFKLSLVKTIRTRQALISYSRFGSLVVKRFWDREHFENEIELYTALEGIPSIPKMLGTGVSSRRQRFIVFPNMGKPAGAITNKEARQLYDDVLTHMYAKKYHHHDLHERNILRGRDGRLCLIDFSDATLTCSGSKYKCHDYTWLKNHNIQPPF
ncbi:hypothetical protein DFP72DRAFT_264599 [Ephemerocybe angulata]|uniref:Protein kinase domain-containing protein n=1 Tax=Ephemerocybe angulata TaxID=980116 RepID=A0A8H6I1H9_9AGAR|nr:hypothetical protein DFP72DRAFT_264599 [Tulosesus angulatus]